MIRKSGRKTGAQLDTRKSSQERDMLNTIRRELRYVFARSRPRADISAEHAVAGNVKEAGGRKGLLGAVARAATTKPQILRARPRNDCVAYFFASYLRATFLPVSLPFTISSPFKVTE